MEAEMSMNEDRAEWAEAAIEVFAKLVSLCDVSDETVMDLICDLGHYAKLRVGLQNAEITRLYEAGIGNWLSEDGHPEGDPVFEEFVTVRIEKH
jgi:hypothetical protein